MDEFLFLARNATSLREKTAGLNEVIGDATSAAGADTGALAGGALGAKALGFRGRALPALLGAGIGAAAGGIGGNQLTRQGLVGRTPIQGGQDPTLLRRADTALGDNFASAGTVTGGGFGGVGGAGVGGGLAVLLDKLTKGKGGKGAFASKLGLIGLGSAAGLYGGGLGGNSVARSMLGRDKTAAFNFSKLKSGLKTVLGKKPPVPEPIVPHPTGYSPVGGVPHVPSMPHPPVTPPTPHPDGDFAIGESKLTGLGYTPTTRDPTKFDPAHGWRSSAAESGDELASPTTYTRGYKIERPALEAEDPNSRFIAGDEWLPGQSFSPLQGAKPPTTGHLFDHAVVQPTPPPVAPKPPEAPWGKSVSYEDGDGLPLGKISSDHFVKLAANAKGLRRVK